MEEIEIDLIQPRHIYAPQNSTIGHIWMPTSLLTAASRLISAGCSVNIFDENIKPYTGNSEIIGFNLVGVPYVPVIRERMLQLLGRKILVGGQSLIQDDPAKNEFNYFFPNALEGNNDSVLKALTGIKSLPLQHSVSLIPAYKLISDEVMRLYLSHTFSFYLSQGCSFTCNFCGVDRSRKVQGNMAKIREMYRGMSSVYDDLYYLFAKAQSLGVFSLKFYLSNLDVFQNPEPLKKFAETVLLVRKAFPLINLEITGLSRIDSFVRCVEEYPETVQLLKKAGYTNVGFGVDGYGKDVWKKINKKGNYVSSNPDPGALSVEAIKLSVEYGMQPETLMVFGHPNIDTEESLKNAYEFTLAMYETYGSIPRPHIAKNLIPRSDHWRDAGFREKQIFFENPWMFQLLDFCALATSYTHGSGEFAALVNKYFLKIYEIPGNTTLPIVPIEFQIKDQKVIITDENISSMLKKNMGRYDH